MTVLWTVRATEPTAVFSPQRKYKTVGSSPSPATKNSQVERLGFVFGCNEAHLTVHEE